MAGFSIVTLIMLGLDFSSPVDAVRAWIILSLLVVSVFVSRVQLVRSARHRTHAADETDEEQA